MWARAALAASSIAFTLGLGNSPCAGPFHEIGSSQFAEIGYSKSGQFATGAADHIDRANFGDLFDAPKEKFILCVKGEPNSEGFRYWQINDFESMRCKSDCFRFCRKNICQREACVLAREMFCIIVYSLIDRRLISGWAINFTKVGYIQSRCLSDVSDCAIYFDTKLLSVAFDSYTVIEFPVQPWPLLGNEDFSRKFVATLGFLCGLSGDGYGRFHIGGLFFANLHEAVGGIEQSDSESRKNPIEENKQPLGRVIQKSIVPVAFLFSFVGLIGAARVGGRIARLAILSFSFGWLVLIIYYGLL
jgi:hypothetical protein